MLALEITESTILDAIPSARDRPRAARELGVRLSIDDFGTGYSSLGHLKRLPVDELKIDRSFVLSMQRRRQRRVIVRSTIELGHNLGLTVVAEGVETQESWGSCSDSGATRRRASSSAGPCHESCSSSG